MLAKRHNVDFFATEDIEKVPISARDRYEGMLKEINVNVIYLKYLSIGELLSKKQYDIGYFVFFTIAEEHMDTFRKQQPGSFVFVDSVDVHFSREKLAVQLGLLDETAAIKNKARELNIYRKADAVIVVSDHDKELLQNEKNLPSVYIVPNIVQARQREAIERGKEIIFIGGYAWPPNVDGALWFARDIWPHIHRAVPDAFFSVIGSNPTTEINNLKDVPGINVVGYVPETAPFLNRAAISIAPLRYGGGLKGKVNEAMAYGVPVVTTSVGAQGFNAKNGEHLIIEDKPIAFADACIDLLNNPQKQRSIGLAGQELNSRICSPEIANMKLSSMIGDVEKLRIKAMMKENQHIFRIQDEMLGKLKRLETELSEKDKTISDLTNSRSWKLTAPLRAVHELYQHKNDGLIKQIKNFVRIQTNKNEKNLNKIAALKNKHIGEIGFIIGNGPSVRIEDLEKLKNTITFCANRFYLAYNKMKFRPKYTLICDNQVIRDDGNDIVSRSEGIKIVFYDAKDPNLPRIKGKHISIIRREPRPMPFSKDPGDFVPSGGSVVIAAMQMAYFMGIRTMYLYGIDHTFKYEKVESQDVWTSAKGDDNHFIKNYRGGKNWCPPDLKYIEDSFSECRKFADKNGVVIKNATRGGKLEIFERIDFDEIEKLSSRNAGTLPIKAAWS